MLTSETKKHIDSARQVLVGVVPNPASQIDQITNALIYKFMDDMDQMAIKAGGKPSFFIGDLERYAWTRIMDPRLGNQERMNLYSEALVKFSEAKQLPDLFRNIFKSAFLPYRSPEVLGLFLKEISFFDYKHSEDLGNAYEYLLSIMSSQGDAGQFRTPRHIIDFIVDAVNPTKSDKILDPACGTAGFLISAYKHILEQHDGKDDPEKKEKALTPDERKKMIENFEGYDIDPMMTRIAQVNMYLHQFKNPKIFQYDSLSSEERWGEKFDVILANPPFMSPKGGIRPHSKFSIPSSRSEVLFVDYIMNHLRPNGRAGIIVPEGIIFQSGTAYKQLRKNLIEDGLYAVVSLPSGVFNPYAGVKTSILLFNNDLAKRSKEILFIKIENDGYDLGAQRREIKKNDLPSALEILSKWNIGEKVKNILAVYVDKEKIVKSGDYNLSGDRYRIATDYSNAKWPMVDLKDVMKINFGERITKKEEKGTKYPVYGGGGESFRTDNFNRENEYVISRFAMAENCVRFVKGQFWMMDSGGTILINEEYKDKLDKDFIGKILLSIQHEIFMCARGGAQKNLNPDHFYEIKIPLPPIEIQGQIAKELEEYQNVIIGARQVVGNWKPKIGIDPNWEKLKLGDVCEINPKKSEIKNLNGNTEVSFVPMAELSQNETYFEAMQTKKLSEVSGSYTYFAEDDVLLAKVTPCFENGKAGIARNLKNKIGFGSSEYIVLRPSEKILSEIIYTLVTSDDFKINGKSKMTGTGGLQRIPSSFVENFEIYLPSLKIQKQIVEKIEAERVFVDGNKKLIEIYEQKNKDVIAKLRSK